MPTPDPTIATFFERALVEGVGDAERVGWSSDASQRARFEALLEAVAPGDLRPDVRLLDVGSGLGDLYGWLKETGREVDYCGVDLSEGMVTEARRRYPDARFEVGDALSIEGEWDIILCSGTFGVRFESEALSWHLMECLIERARWVLALNLLSQPISAEEGTLRGEYWMVDPVKAYPRLRRISPRLTLREDVLPDELVVYLYRDYTPTFRGPLLPRLHPHEHAELLVLRGDAEGALRILRDAPLPEAPGDLASHHVWRGAALTLRGDLRAAEAAFRAGAEADPTHFQAGASLVHVCLGRSDVRGAAEALTRALSTTRAAPQSRDWLLREVYEALISRGDFTQAEALLPLAEGPGTLPQLHGWAALKGGDLDGALAHYAQAAGEDPQDLRILLRRAQVQIGRGELLLAMDDLLRVLAQEPHHQDARGLALQILGEREHIEEAGRLALLARLRRHPVLGPVVRRFN